MTPDRPVSVPPPSQCDCPEPFADLVTVIDGVSHPVRAADTVGATEAFYCAYCRNCQAEYPGSWRLIDPPADKPRTPPVPPVKQELLW